MLFRSIRIMLVLTFMLLGVIVAPAPARAADTSTNRFDANTLNYGIHWYGLGNRSQKAVPGVANPYFNPSKPTVIYVHGWQNGSSQRGTRESFNYYLNDSTYGVDINMADAWVNAGWNIGIFYWNQFADEGEVKDAESKIWTASGPRGMRWRKADGTYTTAGVPAGKSANDLFYDAYVQAMSGYTGTNVRITGHSLGNQMATRLTYRLHQAADAGQIPANLRPGRLALLDPFWSKDGKDYLGGRWTGQVAREQVSYLKTKSVAIEYYKSSGISDVGVGDSNGELQRMVAFISQAPWYIPSWDLAGKHIASYNEYFYSFAAAPPPECTISWGTRTHTGNVAASASTSDTRIREMMRSDKHWVQVEGRNTQNPSDDWFEIKSR